MVQQVEISVNVPECDDFSGLTKYTYHDFCQAMDYINQGVYVTRAKTEAAYAGLLTKLYRAPEGDKYHEGAFTVNRTVYGMAGGKESDLEKYWAIKAYECSKEPEQANQPMLRELATSLLGDPQDLDLDLSELGRLSMPQYPILENELYGIPKAAKKLLLATLAIRPKLSDADQEAEFLALRNLSISNVNQASNASGGRKIYDDVGHARLGQVKRQM